MKCSDGISTSGHAAAAALAAVANATRSWPLGLVAAVMGQRDENMATSSLLPSPSIGSRLIPRWAPSATTISGARVLACAPLALLRGYLGPPADAHGRC